MENEKYKVELSNLTKIIEGFEKLGITEGQYPEYIDAESFAQTFTECSALKNVPLITLGSSRRLGM